MKSKLLAIALCLPLACFAQSGSSEVQTPVEKPACCLKAEKQGKTCEKACCVKAAKAGKVCEKCLKHKHHKKAKADEAPEAMQENK
jgi:hypothetical protein